jgi:hypothetical protein
MTVCVGGAVSPVVTSSSRVIVQNRMRARGGDSSDEKRSLANRFA